MLAAGCASDRAATSIEPYDRVEIEGFEVRPNRAWQQVDPDAYGLVIAALREDLANVTRTLPPAALAQLRKRPIWIERDTPPAGDGFSGRGMTFHPSRDWLSEHGILPDKAGGIDICNARDYLAWREHQPMMVLHELAHAYHWLLDFERPDVIATFGAARDAGLYQAVDYALAENGEKRPAYALSNHKEYFAELSEAYFGRNDFFPFTRDQLRAYDPAGYELVERLWHLNAAEIEGTRKDSRVGEDPRVGARIPSRTLECAHGAQRYDALPRLRL
jgi:hypothetical protein